MGVLTSVSHRIFQGGNTDNLGQEGFANILIGLFVFFVVLRVLLCILDTSSLSDILFVKIFSHSVGVFSLS